MVALLTGVRRHPRFGPGSSIRGTVTGLSALREDHLSRGFCLSPSLVAVTSDDHSWCSAPQYRGCNSMAKVKLKWFNNGRVFALIAQESCPDVFVYFTAIQADGSSSL